VVASIGPAVSQGGDGGRAAPLGPASMSGRSLALLPLPAQVAISRAGL
jgi:hypothetical protein